MAEELKHLKAYLAIEQARFPNRFDIQMLIPESLHQAAIPPFVIQILVENALKHAFAGRKKDNHVGIKISTDDQALHLQVKDNGKGIAKDLLPKLGKEVIPSSQGTGSALENLNRRLINLYGDASQLVISSNEQGSCFDIYLPLQWIEGDKV
ncbi:LytS/YhcK-type transmembrane receptor domain protein [Streptococcus pseudoporcinus]|nr:LytS/YhcK-type transmembrane receptor domain protein [Streptococcus pseudoporcinus]